MNEFENRLIIKEETYQNGLFPRVPNSNKRGSAFILTGGCSDDIIVDKHTTVKQIRQGKYTRLVEISTVPYLKEIKFQAPSKEAHYSFEVYVKAVIQVNAPITFYENRNIDVDAYFDNLFSLDVRRITRTYSILNSNGMDEELTKKLSSYSTVDEATGFSYRISVVGAMPGENAKEYVQRFGKQQLDAEMKRNAHALKGNYSNTYEEAIMTEVVEGKLSEAEAILKIKEYKNLDYEEQMNRLDRLRKEGYLTDKEVRDFVPSVIEKIGTKKITKQASDCYSEQSNEEWSEMNEFYPEEND